MNQLAERNAELVTQNAELQRRVEALAAENAVLKDTLECVISPDNEPEYHDQGMGCGVEDRGLQRDGYEACAYGWESAMERVYSEVIPDAMPETPATDAELAEIRDKARAEAVKDMCAAFVKHKENAGLDDEDVVSVKEATDAMLHCAEQLCKESGQ